MLTGWGGQLPSVVEPKTRFKGETESVGAAVRVSVAGILTEVGTSPVEAIVTVPVYVPAASDPGEADTTTSPGVQTELELGVTVSQFESDEAEARTVVA